MTNFVSTYDKMRCKSSSGTALSMFTKRFGEISSVLDFLASDSKYIRVRVRMTKISGVLDILTSYSKYIAKASGEFFLKCE